MECVRRSQEISGSSENRNRRFPPLDPDIQGPIAMAKKNKQGANQDVRKTGKAANSESSGKAGPAKDKVL